MANIVPIKVLRTNGDTDALSEFNVDDTIGVEHGGTGGSTSADARTVLDVPSNSDLSLHTGSSSNPHSVTALQIGALDSSLKGAVGGLAELDLSGKVPASQIPAIAIPSVHVVADATARLALTVQEGDETRQLDDNSHWIYDGSTWYSIVGGVGGSSIFGEGATEVEDMAISTTTSDNFQLKLSLIFNVTAGYKYRYAWAYQWNHDHSSSSHESIIMLDSVEIQRHTEEPKDSNGAYGSSGTSQRMPASGFAYFTASTTGITTLEIFWRTNKKGKKSSIFDSRLEQWRVS